LNIDHFSRGWKQKCIFVLLRDQNLIRHRESPNSWMKDLGESDKFSAHDISSNVLAEWNKEVLILYLHKYVGYMQAAVILIIWHRAET
jgi:hypothetical protein